MTITSHTTFHSGHLAITVILRGPDDDRYGQDFLYLPFHIDLNPKITESLSITIHYFHYSIPFLYIYLCVSGRFILLFILLLFSSLSESQEDGKQSYDSNNTTKIYILYGTMLVDLCYLSFSCQL